MATVRTGLIITGDGSGGVKAVKATEGALKKFGNQKTKNTRIAKDYNKSLKDSSSLLGKFKGLIATVGLGLLAREYSKLTDEVTTINNRLKLVTNTTEEYAKAQKDVFNIAQQTRQPLSATAELYQRIARNQDELKLTGQGVADITKTISQTMIISGTSAQSSSAALIQLGQAFASGTLRGEELNSVMEQAPALANAIAKGMGVSVGQLRELGKQGLLTAKQVIESLKNQAESVQSQFDGMAITIGQAWVKIKNSVTNFVGAFDAATGASKAYSGVIDSISKKIDELTLSIGDNARAWAANIVFAIDVIKINMGLWVASFAPLTKGMSDIRIETENLGFVFGFIGESIGRLTVNMKALVEVVTGEAIKFAVETKWQFQQGWLAISSSMELIWLGLKRMIAIAADGVLSTVSNLIDKVASAAEFLGATGLAKSIREASDALDGMAHSESLVAAEIDLVKQEHISRLAVITQERDISIGAANDMIAGALATRQAVLDKADADMLAAQESRNGRIATDAAAKSLDKQAGSSKDAADATKALTQSKEKAIEKNKELVVSLQEEYSLLQFSGKEKAIEIELRKLSAEATDAQRNEVERLAGALYDEQNAVDEIAAAWEESTKRIDEAFADAWAGAFDSFGEFKDRLVDGFKTMLAEMAHLAITKPILLSLGLGGAGSASASGGGGGLSSLGSLFSYGKDVFSGFSSGGLSGGFDALTNPLVSGLTGITDSAINFLFNAGYQDAAVSIGNALGGIESLGGGNLALGGLISAGAGFAGSYAGNAVGEGLFGKQAESNLGATIGTAIGTFIAPGIGSAIGGFLGGLADVAFGGDGKKRAALGVRTGADLSSTWGDAAAQARGASGLLFTSYTKRAGSDGDSIAASMVEQFVRIDNVLTGALRALGGVVDLEGQSLEGKAFQAGKTGGDFFGSAIFNGVDGEDVEGAAGAFVAAWLDAVGDALPASIARVLPAIEQDVATLVGTIAGFANIEQLLGVDVVSAARELGASTSSTLATAYREQTDLVLDLASAYDGSLGTLESFERGLIVQRELAARLANEIVAISASVEELFGNTRKSIVESLLTSDELFSKREGERAGLLTELGSALDPDRIAEISTQLNSLTSQLFESLTSDQRATLGQEYILFLDEAALLAKDRLDTAMSQITADNAAISGGFDTAVNGMIDAVTQQTNAAATQAAASAQFAESVEAFTLTIQQLNWLGLTPAEVNI